jgi:hypothetical protein
MPSQICHLIFAEDSLREAVGSDAEEMLRESGNIYRFGAQGPDFFYHNQRTRPTGLKFGVNAHREGSESCAIWRRKATRASLS